MDKRAIKILKEYKDAVEKLANYFEYKYFIENEETGWHIDSRWVAYEVGGIYEINDFFFDINDMIDFIRYDYTPDEMFKYYWEREDNREGFPSIKNWKKKLRDK